MVAKPDILDLLTVSCNCGSERGDCDFCLMVEARAEIERLRERAKRVEELLQEASIIMAEYAPGFTVIQDNIDAALAIQPDSKEKV